MSNLHRRRMAIGDFLLRRLEEAGIGHLFGVPGDYNLGLLQQLQDTGALQWIGTTGELTASYAADGYARLRGLGGLLVTNGVGALGAINGVAGAYAEHVPLICIAGSIPLKSIERGQGMHHTMGDGTWDHFLDAFAPVTAAQVRLTPRNAADEIDRLILMAWREKLPVYLELPSDITHLEIEVPVEPLPLVQPASDAERLQSSVSEIARRLAGAKSPAILVDADAARFEVTREIMALAEKMQIPVAAAITAKAVIDETFPHYIGIYNGAASEPGVREAIEGSDCLLSIGYRPIEVSTGDFTASLPSDTIHVRGHSVDVGDLNFQAVTIKEMLQDVGNAVDPVKRFPATSAVEATRGQFSEDVSKPLTQAAYWPAMEDYLRSGDVVYVDNGTSYALLGLKFPKGVTFIGSINWGSIGYSVGALLGGLIAAPERRHLLFIGDGSFQVTAQEVSTILRHDLKPVIFLINNGGYTIERGYLGKSEPYNDIANWSYAALPKVLRPGTSARSFVVKSVRDLNPALNAPNDTMIFVESIMDPYDAPAAIIGSSNKGAELDYGPRGPQRRKGVQLRPATEESNWNVAAGAVQASRR